MGQIGTETELRISSRVENAFCWIAQWFIVFIHGQKSKSLFITLTAQIHTKKKRKKKLLREKLKIEIVCLFVLADLGNVHNI